MKKKKRNEWSKTISFSYPFFFVAGFAFVVLFVGTTPLFSATTTELAPDFINTNTTQGVLSGKILDLFQGMIPNNTAGTVSSQPKTIQNDVFTKNLRIGDDHTEVFLLQKALNEDPDTTVSITGPGSSGNETTYFGQKTKIAVIKLQNKHYGEVLAPNGLSVGTGYFGASTRAMMNNMQKNKGINTTQGESVTTTIPKDPVSGIGGAVKIESLEPTHGKSGTTVIIHGSGMTNTANKIIAGGKQIYNVTSTDGKTLSFVMEAQMSFVENPELSIASSTYIKTHFNEYKTDKFPILKYPVCVANDNGMSNCAFFIIDL